MANERVRKLALLVGLDRYTSAPPLRGCRADIERQRQLLLGCYGFHPEDIWVVTDAAATRSGIEQIFQAELIQRAQPGDWVVFHFSGYGRRLPNGEAALMTFTGEAGEGSDDLSLKMLWLLLQRLSTRNGLVVLDCSFDDIASSRHLALRCRPPAEEGLSPAAMAAQMALQQQLGLSAEQVSLKLQQGWPQSIVFGSSAGQAVAETAIEGECCGLFTAAWTRALWQRPAAGVQQWWGASCRAIARYRGSSQIPRLLSNSQIELDWSPLPPSPGSARVLEATGEPLTLWLGGVSLGTASAYGPQAQLLSTTGAETLPLEILRRQGLRVTAQGRRTQPGPEGGVSELGPLVEAVRRVPRQSRLVIEWDPSVNKVERVDGAAALARLNWIEIADGDGCGAARIWSAEGRYGVAGEGRWKAVQAEGAIGSALNALVPSLRNRLALQQLQQLLNEGPMALPLTVLLQSGDKKLLQTKSGPQTLAENDTGEVIPQLSGDLRLRLLNPGQQPLELLIIAGDRQGEWRWLHPAALRSQTEETDLEIQPWQIAPGSEASLPLSGTAGWPLTGYGEIWILGCQTGWPSSRAILQAQLQTQSSPNRIEPNALLTGLLSDLATASQPLIQPEIAPEVYSLAVSNWVGLCLGVSGPAA
jgi:hypothetical protein